VASGNPASQALRPTPIRSDVAIHSIAIMGIALFTLLSHCAGSCRASITPR
jgi:hypothetical protein